MGSVIGAAITNSTVSMDTSSRFNESSSSKVVPINTGVTGIDDIMNIPVNNVVREKILELCERYWTSYIIIPKIIMQITSMSRKLDLTKQK